MSRPTTCSAVEVRLLVFAAILLPTCDISAQAAAKLLQHAESELSESTLQEQWDARWAEMNGTRLVIAETWNSQRRLPTAEEIKAKRGPNADGTLRYDAGLLILSFARTAKSGATGTIAVAPFARDGALSGWQCGNAPRLVRDRRLSDSDPARQTTVASNILPRQCRPDYLEPDTHDPIDLYLFLPNGAGKAVPAIGAHVRRVRSLLERLHSASPATVRVTELDPSNSQGAREQAARFGIESVEVPGIDQPVIFGLAARNALGGESIIPFLNPERAGDLEHDLAAMVISLHSPRPRVGLIAASIPIQDPSGTAKGFHESLGKQYTLRALASTADRIDSDIDVLIVVQPDVLGPDTIYAIDQYVLRGGRLLMMVDPMIIAVDGNAGSARPAAKGNGLDRLFASWGIAFDPSKVVVDRGLGVSKQDSDGSVTVSPVTLGLGPSEMNRKDTASKYLQSVILDAPGVLDLQGPKGRSGLVAQALLSSSQEAVLIESSKIAASAAPSKAIEDPATPRRYVLAARLSGNFRSAFPERTGSGHLPESARTGGIVLIADIDIATDRTWISTRGSGKDVESAPFANNGDFLLNVVDQFASESSLSTIAWGSECLSNLRECRPQTVPPIPATLRHESAEPQVGDGHEAPR